MKKLSDRIWETWKSRIYTERRLSAQAATTEFLLMWYSLFLVAASIWVLRTPAELPNYLTVMGSIAVLVASVYLSAQNYRARAVQMRNHYISLATLESRARLAEGNGDEEALRTVEETYREKLADIENHTEYDYLCLRFSRRQDDRTTLPHFYRGDWVAFLWAKTWRYCLIVILSMLPFGLALVLARIGKAM